MSLIELNTIETISGSTHHITDSHKCLAALAYARLRNIPDSESLPIIIGKRMRWLNWQAMTQRQWQMKTRNHNKANHHDSIALREKYVTCK